MRLAATAFLVLFACASPASSAPDLCHAAGPSLKAALRAQKSGANAQGLSIRAAVAKKPVAGLDFGGALDDKTLRSFPLGANDRFLFKDSVRHIFRAGGAKGLVMLDAATGTALCHAPFLFDLASGAPKVVTIPDPGDPFELCRFGGVALGALGGKGFYAQTYDDFAENDRLKLFPLEGEALGKACMIEARYAIDYQTPEANCEPGASCADLGGKAALWARAYRGSGGGIVDPSLAQSAPIALPEDDPAAFPSFAAGSSKLVPEPFRFDGAESFYAVKGEPRADVLRIGAAWHGPANMARWDAFTLAVLYKLGRPVASFVVERKRGAFQGLQIRAD